MLCNRPLLAFGQGVPSGGARFVSLDHISPERGREFLSKLNLATASPLPGTNALLVTASPEDVQKAVALLGLVDAPEVFEVRKIGPASLAASLPSNERIATAVGNLCIGSFAHPPRETGKAKAIIDLHNGSIWAVAPIFQLQEIALAVELGPQVLEQRRASFRQGSSQVAPNAPQTVPAVTPRSAADSPGTEPSLWSGPRENPADSGKITLPDDMQRKLLETRLWAAELNADRLGTSNLGVLPARLLEADRNPLALDLAIAQADSNETSLPLPSSAGDAADRPEEPTTLQPGQIVPTQTDHMARTAGNRTSDRTSQSISPAGDYTPTAGIDDDRIVDLNLPEKLPVIQLLDLVGKYMNLDYIYDPTQITGEVTLKLNGDLRGSMKVKDLYLLLESVLKFQNLVMTRHRGNIVTIVPVAQALDVDPGLVGPGGRAVEAGDVVVTRVFELQYIDTVSAQNLLDSMRLSIGVTPIPESGTMIVTAYAHRMARIEQLLNMVDRPGEPRRFRFRQLRYTMAMSLAEKVKALAEQLESVSVTVGVDEGAATPAKQPGESEVAYRQRLARLRVQQQQQAAAAATAARRPGAAAEPVSKPGVYLDADERTNRILMIGVQNQLDLVEDLIDSLDVAQQDLRSMKLYRIRHVDAEEVRGKFRELGIITTVPETGATGRLTGQPRTNAQQTAAQQQAAAAARAAAAVSAATGTPMPEIDERGPVGEPQVVVVESTNSLLVNATAEQHARIETIISFVDSETCEDEIPYRIYPLENSSPGHLAQVFQSLIQETTEYQDPEGKIQTSVTKRREQEITIVPDPNTYSLIVYASKKNQEWISNLVRQLDKRRPQVLIDVTLVEISKTDAFNYDLNLIQSIPDLTATSGLTGGIAEGVTSGTILEKLLQSDRSQFADMQWDGDNFRAFYGDKHINALLTAMQSKNYGRVLAKPKILVNDNEPGTIKTTDTTYVEKTSSIPVSSGSAGTDTTLIQTAVDYTPYEAGITLNITPHISEGNLLRLDIGLVRSDFTSEDPKKPPNTTASELNTAVTVPDGSTIILGGLIKLNQTKGGRKVPILGDIPLVGGLFRGVNNSDRQSKLYIFVKAEVIRPGMATGHSMEELERLSERNRLAFEQHEKEFQSHQSWPGFKPKPVQPERVLEAQ
ncbi:secretin N-terminal domain-containing protein [Anaerobaca lacustris]|uniref:Secretin N-terminal domain-containing protein n=1 Tax=Anaerobaca lacustris TaxID=3044600 RepID=A0AAW6TX14_9BACT|nr:secretin N-terminal domain-containing protein [Sedimentisphaerales bacterium M17dextr]